MFGIGLPEFAVIAFVAVLVFGPDKLPELARQAAHLTRKARSMATSARDELRGQLGPEYQDLELRDLDPRSIVRRHIREAWEEEDRNAPTTPTTPTTPNTPAAEKALDAGAEDEDDQAEYDAYADAFDGDAEIDIGSDDVVPSTTPTLTTTS